MNKPLAIFDIDGTLYRWSLMFELFKELVERGALPRLAFDEIDGSYKAWKDRQGHYDDFTDEFVDSFYKYLPGCPPDQLKKAAIDVVEAQKNRVYVYTRDLIKSLKDSHTLIALSGSPHEIVEEFQKHWHFNIAFGTDSFIANGEYTGEHHGMVKEKKVIKLKEIVEKNNFTLKDSIGVGDTKADTFFLELVENPIAFNPSKELYDYANERGWKVVVERKNMVYEM